MSADETLGSPVPEQPENSGSAVMTDDSQPADPASAGAEPDSQQPAAENAPAEPVVTAPRKPRLNPSVDPKQFKAVPTLKPFASAPSKPAAAPAADAPQAETHNPVESPAEAAAESTAAEVAVTAPEQKPAPAEAREQKPQRRTPPVELPPANQSLDAELEAEIEAAMSSGQLDLMSGLPVSTESEGSSPTETVTEETLEAGAHLTGRIQSISGDNVFLDLGFRSPGVTSARQFVSGKKAEVGQLIEVIVDKVDAAEGLILVNLPRGMRKIAGNWDAISKGQVVDCVVNKTNKGGLEVTVSGLRAFLPSSQVEVGFAGDLESYVGQKLRVQVTEVNPKKRNLVVSRRAYLQVERKEAEENLWKTLEVGQVFTGKIKTIKDYGAFVDLGGVDGFLHVGEISWQRIQKPSDLLQEGQEVQVKVIALNPETKKISLGMRQLAQNPWTTAATKYPVSSRVNGKITRVADFGAFVELEPGLEGLIHVSEIDHKHVRRVADVLKVHQTVEAQVIEVDAERKRVSLSLKALLAKPDAQKPDEDLAPSGGEVYQRKHKGPLKGGTGSSGGGGLFGNPTDFGNR
ncbi:MAG: S1 RNA-binding domain-containing protein [Planctomycetaceae bacterium]